MLSQTETQGVIDAVCAAPGAGEGVPQEEMRRILQWAYDLRAQALLLDDVIGGRTTVRWPGDEREPRIFAARKAQS